MVEKKTLHQNDNKDKLSVSTSVALQDEDAPSLSHDAAEVHRPRIAGGASSAISHFHNESQ